MFNALWLNGQEIGGSGQIQRIIKLGASVSAGATADPLAVARRRGLKSSCSAGATGTALQINKRKWFAASATVGVPQTEILFQPTRNMAAHGYVLTDSFFGGSFSIQFSANATAGAQAMIFPFEGLFDGVVSTGATATAALSKIQFFAGAVTAGADTAGAVTDVVRQAFSSVTATASAVAVPDVTIGGVRHADMAAFANVDVSTLVTIDPKKALYGSGQAGVEAHTVGGLSKTILLESNPQVATVYAEVDKLTSTRTMATVPVTVTATASSTTRLSRKTNLKASAMARAFTLADPRMSAARHMRAGAQVTVTADNHVERRRGLASAVTARVVSNTPSIKLAEKLAAYAFAGATVDTIGYFTTRNFETSGIMAGANASAYVLVNLYDKEPDFRTLFLDPEDWRGIVDPEDWTLSITDDSTAMKTFQKQPADVLAYDIDFTTWFEQIPNDDIESSTCVVVSATDGEPTNLTVNSVINVSETPGGPAKRVKVWIQDGLDQVTYKLTLVIVTEDGRTKEVDFQLKVKEI